MERWSHDLRKTYVSFVIKPVKQRNIEDGFSKSYIIGVILGLNVRYDTIIYLQEYGV